MMAEGLNLMIFGMGTVVLFLTILVFATMAMSAVISRFAPEEADSNSTPRPVTSSLADSRIITVIEAAVAQHRAKK